MIINIPAKVDNLIRHMESCGYEAFAVGGCVRDSLLGRTPNDWDLCTNATPDEMKSCFATALDGGAAAPDCPKSAAAPDCPKSAVAPCGDSCATVSGRSLSDCRIIETGLKHGTLTVLLDGETFEITTYRIDGEYSDGRHPDTVSFTRSIEEDLARRDFTVNAMAYNNSTGLVDPFGGRDDLAAGLLRCVGDPVRRFTEDSLRILRGVRFASQLSYEIDAETAAAMYKCLPLLDRVAVERIRVELEKLLCGPAASDVLRTHRDIIAHVIPELRPMFDLNQKNAYHVYDVWEHSLQVLSHIPATPILRLAALFHDIGKPPTMTIDYSRQQPDGFADGWGHFYGHEPAGAEITNTIMRRLKFDNTTRETICAIIDAHKIVFQPTAKHARRLLNKLGEERLRMLIDLELADVKSQNPIYTDERVANISAFALVLDEVLAEEQCFSMKHLAIGGRDLMELGVPQGREIGRILNALLDQVVEGNLPNEKAVLLEAAAKIL